MLPGLLSPLAGVRSGTMAVALAKLGLTSGLTLCLDASDFGSVTSASQAQWKDVSGGGYDFDRGVSGTPGDEPSFNGAPGGKSASEYYSFNGSQRFVYDSSNEAWMEALHKDAAVWAWASWLYWPGEDFSVERGIFGTNLGSTSWIGVGAEIDASDNLTLLVSNGSGACLSVQSDVTIPINAWTFVAGRVDEGANTYSLIVNGTTKTGAGAYSAPSSGAATATMGIGSCGGTGGSLPSGSRIASLAMWYGTIPSATSLGNIRDYTRGKFGV